MSLRRMVLGCLLLASAASAQPKSKAECANAAEKAQSLREAKKLKAARQELLLCSHDQCPKAVRADCVSWLREVEGSTPSVVLRARGARGDDLVDVKVSLDGQPLASSLDGAAVPVDPGPHTFRFEHAGEEPLEVKALISEGEKNRTVQAEWRKKDEPPRAASASAPAPTSPAAPPPPAATSSALPWVFVGVGALSAAAFGGLQLWARGDLSKLEDGCGKTRTCPASEVDPVRSKFIGSGVALGVSVLSFGVAGALFLWAPSKGSSVGFSPGPGGGSVSLVGAF